jgi:hypothetical protein
MFHNPQFPWTKKMILFVYITPMVTLGALSLVLYALYKAYRRHNTLLRLYLLWAHVFSLTLLFASLIQGVFSYHGLAVIFTWQRIPPVSNQVIGVLAGGGLLACGYIMRTLFLKLAPSTDWQVERHPRRFIVQVAFLPALFALVLLGAIALKVRSMQFLVMMGTPLILLIGILAFSLPLSGKMILVKNFPIDRFSPAALLGAVATALAILYLAGHGIRLGF